MASALFSRIRLKKTNNTAVITMYTATRPHANASLSGNFPLFAGAFAIAAPAVALISAVIVVVRLPESGS